MLLLNKPVVAVRRFGLLVESDGLRRPALGFTLIEAMITAGLLAILLGLAIPSYTGYVTRANRTEAMQVLMTTASCQERKYSSVNAYDANACAGSSSNGDYAFSIETSNGNHSFLASAAPQGAQLKDNCGVLSIDQAGIRIAAGQSGNFAVNCWKGK
jgi:type IV pilus assembly protein PilE